MSWMEVFYEAMSPSNWDAATFNDTVILLHNARYGNHQLCFIGNGGSAAIASHMAIDFLNKGRFKARSFNDPAALTCLANDYGYESVFCRQVSEAIRVGDVLVAISSSGESENIVRAAKAAETAAARIVTLTGFKPGNRLSQLGMYNFHIPCHNYGVVETAHLGLLHALLEAVTE